MMLVVFLYMVCASMFTISKWALAYSQPLFFVAVRMLGAGLLLNGYCLLKNNQTLKHTLGYYIKRDWFLFAQVILFHIYLTYVCDACALKNISSIESAFLYNLSPFIAALFSYMAFAEKMTPKKWLGLSLGFFSLIPSLLQEAYQGVFLQSLTPKLITFGAVVFSAYGWVVVRKLVKEREYSSIFVNGIGMFFGGLLALVTSGCLECWDPFPVTHWIPFIHATLLIIVVANLLFYNLYGYLLKQYTATFLSFAGFMCPVFAALLGWLFLGERISSTLLVSFVFVLMGLYIFYQEELRQGYIESK